MSCPEDQFQDLQRLLRCKRYEEPPPGYFLSFSDKVMAQIEAEESFGYSSWWDWMVARFDAKPVMVCAFGLAVSGLLFLGFRLSQVFEAEMAMMPVGGGPGLATTPASPVTLPPEFRSALATEAAALPFAFAAAKSASWDDSTRWLLPRSSFQVQPVSFGFGEH